MAQAADETLLKAVAMTTALVWSVGTHSGPDLAPCCELPETTGCLPFPIASASSSGGGECPQHFEPATASLETKQVPNWLGLWP